MNIAKNLLDIAKKDLEASLNLFESRHYNLALFHLQQCVEKCVKSYGINYGIIPEKALVKEISHLPHKVFAKQFKQRLDKINEDENHTILVPDLIPPHQRNIDTSENKSGLEKIFNKTNFITLSDMEKVSIADIKQFIHTAKIEREWKPIDEDLIYCKVKEDFVKTNEHFLDYFINVLNKTSESKIVSGIKKILENPDPFAEIKFQDRKYAVEKENKVAYLMFVWFNMSIITSPHEQKTRYPSMSGKNPEEIYLETSPLVLLFPEFVSLMKESITIYTELLTN